MRISGAMRERKAKERKYREEKSSIENTEQDHREVFHGSFISFFC